jgi:regulator of RNase E activity RraA
VQCNFVGIGAEKGDSSFYWVAMTDYAAFQALSPTTLADTLTRDRVMDIGIRPLWQDMPRIAGPAYTVLCPAGDHLMLHAAIYRAPAGSVIVAESGDVDYALAGGNVCAVAQKRGVAAFVVDGAIRDLAESRSRRFPVFARGVIPIPGGKEKLGELNGTVHCGGVEVSPGDIVVADEEGIVVVPKRRSAEVLEAAQKRAKKDAAQTLDEWEAAHRSRIDEILRNKGFAG